MITHRRSLPVHTLNIISTVLVLTASVLSVFAGSADAQDHYTPADKADAPVKSPSFLVSETRDSARRDSTVRKIFKVQEHLGQLALDIPEYHDEQPFRVDGNHYGPMAYIFASPYLDGFTSINQINAHGPFGVFVATVWVDAPDGAALPEPYAGLKLQGGMNCVYLAHTSTSVNGNWRAYVLPGSEATGCKRPSNATPTLGVKRVQSPGLVGQGDYPGVARFDEDVNGRPLFGVRCLNAWCQIGTPGFAGKDVAHKAFLPLSTVREGRVRGWHDEQLLSVRDPASGELRPAIRASVTPVHGLNTKPKSDYNQTWIPVATIWLGDDPVGTKYDKLWGMEKGSNRLDLAFADGQWHGRITPLGSPNKHTRVIVDQHKHLDMVVPGTARFRWRIADEGVWVPCDQGCCRVDAISG